MSRMRFKAGDIVRMKTLDWYRSSIHPYIESMAAKFGKDVMITDAVYHDSATHGYYKIDHLPYRFDDYMIQRLVFRPPVIKFRAVDLKCGKWRCGDLLNPSPGEYLIRVNSPHENSEDYRVDAKTIEQFTGRYDKDGHEIYSHVKSSRRKFF